jgi:MtfA peptidase
MILTWLRQRRRARILAEPFPPQWLAWLQQNLAPYADLNADEQARLRDALRVFIAEKNWEGCGGFTVTPEMQVTIAAHACLMTLALPGEPFRGVLSILVYPAGYAVPEERAQEGGWSITGEAFRLGESWYRGPVILSWEEIEAEIHNPGQANNLIYHEFAHQIDMLDRSTNGTPPLETSAQRARWHEIMTREFERLRADAQAGRPTLLDPYGAGNEAEFFAVSTECFFDCPVEMRELHPGLYELLSDYYRQDPAERAERS